MSKASKEISIEQYVADYVKKLRSEKKISQEGIANIIGVKQPFIGSIEGVSGDAKYNLTHINRLAKYFEISPKDFLPDTPMFDKDDIQL